MTYTHRQPGDCGQQETRIRTLLSEGQAARSEFKQRLAVNLLLASRCYDDTEKATARAYLQQLDRG